MQIRELTREECLDVLAGTRTARLACAHEGQPYIVPVYLAYDAAKPGPPSLFGVTTFGTKVEWMRANPRVCVEVDDVAGLDEWVSVVALGRYEELGAPPRGEGGPDSPRHPTPDSREDAGPRASAARRLEAFEVLQHQAMWWEPSSTAWASRPGRKPGEAYQPIYYRVCIERISGHRASPGATAV